MKLKVELATFAIYIDYVSGIWVSTSGKFNQSGLKERILCTFFK